MLHKSILFCIVIDATRTLYQRHNNQLTNPSRVVCVSDKSVSYNILAITKNEGGKSICVSPGDTKKTKCWIQMEPPALMHLRFKDENIPPAYLCCIGFLCSRKGKDQLDLAMTDFPRQHVH